ncbi:MAG TPA: glycine betaine ABC transporter substrate-binding protein [Fimbriimonadales bacterium]|nr:glycine betaine ABC transporter substrate-binding protein [Fimbriimonadales bacterium]
MKRSITILLFFAMCILGFGEDRTIVIGSKRFTESYVLGEIAKKALQENGIPASHRKGMGGTLILWQALKSGEITVYPEYTGTLTGEILKRPGLTDAREIRRELEPYGIGMSEELGFNNTYALAMRKDKAQKLGITKISDLRKYPELRVGITPEFLGRKDGWRPMAQRYGLKMSNVRAIEHQIGYQGLISDEIDIKDVYSTDAKIAEYGLTILKDDLNFFPKYNAVWLYRLDIPQNALKVLNSLAGTIDENLMIKLNAEAERTKDYTAAADLYFREKSGVAMESQTQNVAMNIARWTLQHLFLVSVSLAIAIAIGIPLGIFASKPGLLSEVILGFCGVVQTVPSLALLALLVPIPFLGISEKTAITALFLYSLLPIVRNTATGLQDIPPSLKESAIALGLPPKSQLLKIYLPLASRSILAGIKTSAVINVGTAVLAAFVGAGGLGEPIISGLNLLDMNTIFQGAIPAAVLALLVQYLFGLLDFVFIPKGLRITERKRKEEPAL